MRQALLIGFTATAFAQEPGPAPVLGEVGESCRARADCQQGLTCVKETCIDPNAPPPDMNVDTREEHPVDRPTPSWSEFRIGRSGGRSAHPFVGLAAFAGPDVLGVSGRLAGGFDKADFAFLFGLSGGVFLGRHQLSLELSPFSYVYDHRAQGPAFQVTGSWAYFIPLADTGKVTVHWPLRVGVGLMAGANNTQGLAYFQVRTDVVGLAVQYGHLMFEISAPSFRWAVSDRRGSSGWILSWLSGVTATYVF